MNLKILQSSIVIILLTLGVTKSVAQCGFTPLNSSYCSSDPAVALVENESGGSFTINSIPSTVFDPGALGPGTHTVEYINTDFYTVDQSGTFSPFSSGSGWNTVPSGVGNLEDFDDALSDAIPIGFTFDFFENSYTQLFASSNGNISFTSYVVNWVVNGSTGITNTSLPNNMIALARDDLDPSTVGPDRIRYRTEGVSPNRIFILEYNDVDKFGSTNEVTVQLKLFETTNVIEIHTTLNQSTTTSQTSLQGIENSTGTIGFAVPGRNNSVWSVTNDFVSFTPCIETQIVTVDEEVIVNAGVDTNICESSTYSLVGSITGGVTDGVWTKISSGASGTFDNVTGQFSTATTYTLDASDVTNGFVTLRLTSDDPGGGCSVEVDEVTITIDADPTVANAGTDQTGVSAVCGTSTALTGNSATTGNGLWSIVTGDGNGAFVDATSPTTLFTGSEEFTYTLRWTISNGVCVASTSDVAIEFDADPTVANAGLDQQVCGSTGLPVSLSANAPVFRDGCVEFCGESRWVTANGF